MIKVPLFGTNDKDLLPPIYTGGTLSPPPRRGLHYVSVSDTITDTYSFIMVDCNRWV